MTSEQNPDRPPVRRRMAGYTQLAAPNGGRPDAGPAPEPNVPARQHTAAPGQPAAEQPATGQPAPETPESGAPTSGTGTGTVQTAPVAPVQTAPARKTRMGGAPAPKPVPESTGGQGAATDATAASGPATPATGGNTAEADTSTPAPVAKTRMGGAPVAKTRMGSAPAQPAAAEQAPADGAGAAAPSAKQRMGGNAAPKTRMGGAPAQPSAPAPTGGGTASTDGPVSAGTTASTRMTPAPAASTATGVGTAGTPGPAGAATPGKVKGDRPKWVRPVAIIAGLVVVALVVVLFARWLRTLEPIQQFIETYDGHSTHLAAAPEGMPWWMGWQHFFNMFLIVLIIRTGMQVRHERKPPGYWTAKKGSFFSPAGNTPKKVSLSQWLHQCLDVLWVANGLVFVVLLFATGQWMRIVPTDWDVFPNMLSGAIQYASLDWPTENGWVHYNALQVVAYFTTVFIAAPLAILSGLRFSTWWPEKAERLTKAYPVEWARAVHFPVMLYFVGFTIVHVFLVFFTGALRNLNHMYTSRDVVDWWGLVILLASLVVIAAAWFLSKPLFTTPIATRMGKVTK